jgi:hypothetical protein
MRGRLKAVALVVMVVVLFAGLGWGMKMASSGAHQPSSQGVDAPPTIISTERSSSSIDPPPLSQTELEGLLKGLDGKVSTACIPDDGAEYIPVHEIGLKELEGVLGQVVPTYLPTGFGVQRIFVIPALGDKSDVCVLFLISDEPISQGKVENVEQLYTGVAEMGLVWRPGQAKVMVRLTFADTPQTQPEQWVVSLGNGINAALLGDEKTIDVCRLNGDLVYYEGIPPLYSIRWCYPGCWASVEAYKKDAPRDEVIEIACSMSGMQEDTISRVHDFLLQEGRWLSGL